MEIPLTLVLMQALAFSATAIAEQEVQDLYRKARKFILSFFKDKEIVSISLEDIEKEPEEHNPSLKVLQREFDRSNLENQPEIIEISEKIVSLIERAESQSQNPSHRIVNLRVNNPTQSPTIQEVSGSNNVFSFTYTEEKKKSVKTAQNLIERISKDCDCMENLLDKQARYWLKHIEKLEQKTEETKVISALLNYLCFVKRGLPSAYPNLKSIKSIRELIKGSNVSQGFLYELSRITEDKDWML